jgi:hypothetical protein
MSTPERKSDETEGSRRIIFLVVALVSVLMISVILFVLKSGYFGGGGDNSQQPRLENAIRAGTPEFEQYKDKIFMDQPEATEAKRALGDTVMTLRTTVRNFSGRTLNGLEMYAAVVDMQGKPVKERTVIAIPTRQPELEPNKTIAVPVTLEGFKDTDDRANIKMAITAFRFK